MIIKTNNKIEFKDIAAGDCFKYNNEYYMKIQIAISPWTVFKCVNLKDGKAYAYGKIGDIKKKFGGKSFDQIFVEVYGEGTNE